jgi:gliding motility-associated-like protein
VNVKAEAGRDTLVFKNTPFQLRGKGGLSYLWTPSAYLNSNNIPTPIGSIVNDQSFQLEVTDERGCKSTDIVKVQVFVEDDIYVPTSFTPNNDGKNDMFRPIAPTGVVYLFEVFNRWGQKVFSTDNTSLGWNGKIQDILQPSGVYVWHLKAKTRAGKEVVKKGTVMLVW